MTERIRELPPVCLAIALFRVLFGKLWLKKRRGNLNFFKE